MLWRWGKSSDMDNRYEQLLDILSTRHSCRRFSGEPVSEEDIRKILDAAGRSPFASGRKNWKIAVIRDKEQLKAIADCVREQSVEISKGMDREAASMFLRYSSSFTFFENAAALFVPYCRETATMNSLLGGQASEEINAWEHDNITKSLSCVAMLIILAAESLNLGACYMTGPLLAGRQLNASLGIKENFVIGALIPVGHKLEVYAD